MKTIGKLHYNAPVSLTFVLISFLSLLLGNATNFQSTRLLFSTYQSALTDPFFYIRLFGHVLGSLNFEHFFNNALYLLLLGPMLEEKYGSKNLLLMIFVTAFITGIVNCMQQGIVVLGASGIVFMMIILSSFANRERGRIPLTFLLVFVLYLGREVVGMANNDQVSQVSHILGGLCGGLFGYIIAVRKKA